MTEEKQDFLIKNKKAFKVLAIVFAVLGGLFLVFFKISNPEFPLRTMIIFFIIFGAVGSLIYFSSNILHKFRKTTETEKVTDKEKPVKVASQEEMIKFSKDLLETPLRDGGFENHVKEILIRDTKRYGNSTMFHLRIIPLYNDRNKSPIDFIFNAEFSDQPTIGYNLSNEQIEKIMNRMSLAPEPEPDVIETKETVPHPGTSIETKRTLRKEEKKAEEEET